MIICQALTLNIFAEQAITQLLHILLCLPVGIRDFQSLFQTLPDIETSAHGG